MTAICDHPPTRQFRWGRRPR